MQQQFPLQQHKHIQLAGLTYQLRSCSYLLLQVLSGVLSSYKSLILSLFNNQLIFASFAITVPIYKLLLYIRVTLGLPACALPNSNSTRICCAIPLRDAPALCKPTAFVIENYSWYCCCRSRMGINYKLGQRISRVNLKALNFNSIQHNNHIALYLVSTAVLLRKLCSIK